MPESGSKKQIDLKFAYFGQLFAEFSSLPREIQQRVQEVLPPTVQALVQEYAKKGVLPKERLDGLKWAELAVFEDSVLARSNACSYRGPHLRRQIVGGVVLRVPANAPQNQRLDRR